jgi:hypothetical protein
MTDVPSPTPSSNPPDETFFRRADAHINLSNEQLADAPRGEVMASMMFASARWAVWIAAAAHGNPQALANEREKAIDYYLGQFKLMLEAHMEDYVANFAHFSAKTDAS